MVSGPPFPHLLWEYYMHYEVRHPNFLRYFSVTAGACPSVTLNVDLNLWKMRNFGPLWRLQYHNLMALSVIPGLTGLLRLHFHSLLSGDLNLHKNPKSVGSSELHIAALSPCILSFPYSSSTLWGKGVSCVAIVNIFSVIFVVASEDYLWIIAIWGKLCSKSFLYEEG